MRNAATGMPLAVAYVHTCRFYSPPRPSFSSACQQIKCCATCMPDRGMPVSVYT
ncbi:unnamed protein product [Callosobruchus maculatus]|uniref:Uncharacterized protein n=1 Tax=Callosobruchus maculatus TaxID=64391 RepID=A0A653BT17_CALMS|nr:unnamed protein product [Callosobruchus maculatus]